MGALGGTALFAARFRENAARALLLPRRRPGQRTPLWMQRRRSADLLAVAGQYGSFPIILETYRECLRDVFDMPALREVLAGIRSRQVRVVSVETPRASPFAASLLFDYVGSYMYEGDAPLAERRAQALALDRELLAELLGADELRELLDPAAVAEVELELQALAGGRRPHTVDGVHDLLRRVGDLATTRSRRASRATSMRPRPWRRCGTTGARWRFASPARSAGSRSRTSPAIATPWASARRRAWPRPGSSPGTASRWTRSSGGGGGPTRPSPRRSPLRAGASPPPLAAARLAILVAERVCSPRARSGRAARRRSSPIPEVLRLLRRRTLAHLRREVEAVPPEALGRFLPGWHGIGSRGAGMDRLLEVVGQLEGVADPCLDPGAGRPAGAGSATTRRACSTSWGPRARSSGSAAVPWAATTAGSPSSAGTTSTCWPSPDREPMATVRAASCTDGSASISPAAAPRSSASFARRVGDAARSDEEALDALWDLVWAGEVTNDTFGPLRALSLPRSRSRAPGTRPPRPGRLVSMGPPRAAGRWSGVAELVGEGRTPTERGHATAVGLLERHGVVTREAVMSEGLPGGFSAVYPILKAMEEAGRARRGYFVAGLGAAQFALPGAVDRLRAERDAPEAPRVLVLAAADPAQPYGAALAWPRRDDDGRFSLQRVAGAHVIMVDGAATLYLERGGRSLVTLPAGDDPETARLALSALEQLVAPIGPYRELVIERIDREPVASSPLAEPLRALGFRPSYRGYLLRRT